jgi:hypothetical protein
MFAIWFHLFNFFEKATRTKRLPDLSNSAYIAWEEFDQVYSCYIMGYVLLIQKIEKVQKFFYFILWMAPSPILRFLLYLFGRCLLVHTIARERISVFPAQPNSRNGRRNKTMK